MGKKVEVLGGKKKGRGKTEKEKMIDIRYGCDGDENGKEREWEKREGKER